MAKKRELFLILAGPIPEIPSGQAKIDLELGWIPTKSKYMYQTPLPYTYVYSVYHCG